MTVEELAMEKASKIIRLLDNEDFIDTVINEFLGSDVDDLVFQENVDNEKIRDELKARRIFREYIYDIIRQAELLKEENLK